MKYQAKLIERRDCRKDFKEFLDDKIKSDKKWAKYPKCFDLNSEHAAIEGRTSAIGIQFMKCG